MSNSKLETYTTVAEILRGFLPEPQIVENKVIYPVTPERLHLIEHKAMDAASNLIRGLVVFGKLLAQADNESLSPHDLHDIGDLVITRCESAAELLDIARDARHGVAGEVSK